MQAPAITASLTLPPPGAPANGSGNRLIPAAANFARAFADQVATPRPAASKNAPAAASPAGSSVAQAAANVPRCAAKKLTPPQQDNSSKPVLPDPGPDNPIAPNFAVPDPTVQAEAANIPPPQSDSPSTRGGTAATPATSCVTAKDIPANIPVLPPELLPTESAAAPTQAEASRQPTVPPATRNVPSEKNATSAQSATVALASHPSAVTVLPEVPASSVPANQYPAQIAASSGTTAPTASADWASQSPQVSLFTTPAPPSPPAAQATIFPQEVVASAQVQPAPPAAPNTAGTAQQAITLVEESTPQTRPVTVKTVNGSQNAPSKSNPLPGIATESLPPKEIAQAAAIHGGEKSFPDHVAPREFVVNAASGQSTKSDSQNQSGGGTAADQKPADTGQPTANTPETPATNDNPPLDPNSAQATSIPNPLVNEQAAAQSSVKDTPHDPVASDVTPRSPQGAGNPGLRQGQSITNVQIAGNNAQSEIHLAMQADKLGAVELHARVTGEQVGAAIIVEKKEAHAALAVELPLLQQALAEKNLRVEHVWLTQADPHAASGETGNEGNDSSQRFRNPADLRYTAAQAEEPPPVLFAGRGETGGIFDERGHLSVRA